MKKEEYKKYFAIIMFALAIFFILYTIYNFISGFFGALLLYILLLPIFKFLIKKKINKKFAVILVVVMAFIIIIIPILVMAGIISNQILNIVQNIGSISNISGKIIENIAAILPIEGEFLSERFNSLISSGLSLSLSAFSSAGSFFINLFIALFLLYYLFIEENLYKKLEDLIPFNKENSKDLIKKMKDVSYSTIFVGIIIAILQGGLLTISFLIFGVSNALLWGLVAGILSFLPLVGTPLIWIPAVIILFFQEKTFAAIGVLCFGLVLSNIDNLIRPYLGKKISEIHPLVTFIGIFIGVALFGLIGLFLGPLLLALSILIIRMFREEYLH